MLKLSICFFYRRLFRGSKFNIASWVAIITVILWMVAFVVTIAAACGTHVEANWGSFLMLEQQCVDTFRVLLVYAISDVIVDLAILLIPIPLVSSSLTSSIRVGQAHHTTRCFAFRCLSGANLPSAAYCLSERCKSFGWMSSGLFGCVLTQCPEQWLAASRAWSSSSRFSLLPVSTIAQLLWSFFVLCRRARPHVSFS